MKCRAVLPCGDVSMSVWDAPGVDALQEWMDLNLAIVEPGLVTTCHEVAVRRGRHVHRTAEHGVVWAAVSETAPVASGPFHCHTSAGMAV
eukprot:350214-Chlamydomonas_euryale.AAC.6